MQAMLDKDLTRRGIMCSHLKRPYSARRPDLRIARAQESEHCCLSFLPCSHDDIARTDAVGRAIEFDYRICSMTSFSIIVPCYKYGHFLRECVESILTQSIRDVQVMIVNDASPDGTATIAAELSRADTRVTVLTHASNKGHIASYNEALALIDGKYSLVLSADDLLTPGALERAAAALDAYPNVALCFGDDIPFRTGDVRRQPRSTGHGQISYRSYTRFPGWRVWRRTDADPGADGDHANGGAEAIGRLYS